MKRCNSKRAPQTPVATLPPDRLRKALAKCTKAELVDALVEFSEADRRIMRQIQAKFDVGVLPKELIAETRTAISDATDFDERDANRNFSYDREAYSAVKRNFERLIGMGHLRATMELSLELMNHGSYQVEMSDEGLMTEEIEECLEVVATAVGKSDLPAGEVTTWCKQMTAKDRVGFIYDKEIQALQERAKTPHSL